MAFLSAAVVVVLAVSSSIAALPRLALSSPSFGLGRRVRKRNGRAEFPEAALDDVRAEVDRLPVRDICASFGKGPDGEEGFTARALADHEAANEIYHVMLFTGDFHILYASIYESSPHVDQYIIIEGNVTADGRPRDLTWPRREEILGEDIFAPVLHRIRYITFLEPVDGDDAKNRGLSGMNAPSPAHAREAAMRNHALYAFLDDSPPPELLGSALPLEGTASPIPASQAAILLVSDTTEISSRRFIRYLKSCDVWGLGEDRAALRAKRAFPSSEADRALACPPRGKLLGRIPFFDGFLDCPVFRHGERKEYWHPDMVPLACLNFYRWTPSMVREWEGPPPPGSGQATAAPLHWFSERTGYHLKGFGDTRERRQRACRQPPRPTAPRVSPGDVPLLVAHDARGLFADHWYGKPPGWYAAAKNVARLRRAHGAASEHAGSKGAASLRESRTAGRGLPEVAYAITVTKDGPYVDGAAVLGESIWRSCGESPKYAVRLVAFLYDDAVSEETEAALQRFGWETRRRPLPVLHTEIANPVYRSMVEKAGCCGAAEFLKLYAYTATEFERVVLLDMDSFVTGCLEHLFGAEEELLFTHDMGMCPKCERGSRDHVPPYQGGFFVVKPSLETYASMLEIIRRGNFVESGGPEGAWEGSGIGYFWGGRTIQGLLPYYYTHVAPGRSRELPICVYNNMNDSDECRKTPLADVQNAHFTVCPKPWTCSHAHKGELCDQLVAEWFHTRRRLEALMGVAQVPAERHVRQAYCPQGRYRPIFHS